MIKEYTMVESAGPAHFQELVEEKLNKGFELYGDFQRTQYGVFFQAMVKRDQGKVPFPPMPVSR